jgi:hypothetical protein
MAQYNNAVSRQLLFVPCERSPELRPRAQDLEKIRRHRPPAHLLRLVAARQVIASAPPSGQTLKDAVLFPPVVEVRDGYCTLIDATRLLRRPHIHQAVWSLIGQRSQESGIHKAEDCRVGANAQRQRNDGNSRKARVLPHGTKSQAQVL